MDTKRAFIVGCPRSGTTLLQSMIAGHSRVISFPETHFFSQTLPINPVLRRLKLHGQQSRQVIKSFLAQNGYNSLTPFEEFSSFTFLRYSQWCQQIVDVLDQMILHDAGSRFSGNNVVIGLEKTPRHLHYISSIEQTQSSNKFIHILRNGADVVASLHLATNRYPEEWGGQRSVRKCIRWWNKSIEASLKHRGKPNHFFVTYEQLISDPERVLRAVCPFLGLSYQTSMAKNFHRVAGSLTQKEEAWKDQNTKQNLRKSDKLNNHFDASMIAHIKAEIKQVELQQFHH